MTPKTNRVISNWTWGSLAFLGIGILWQVLEAVIYGEVQPRIVDDLIALAWLSFVGHAYNRGYRHGWEDGHGQHQ